MRILIFLIAFFFTKTLFSQDHFCGSTEVQNLWFSKHPELKKPFDALQSKAEAEDKEFFSHNTQQKTTSAATFTVPMVFHILHQGGFENISDAQVIDAVSILNRDYRKLNPDTAIVVPSFKQIIGDVKFKFVLATKDPNGNCTNGIIRHWDPKTYWDWNDFSYYTHTWDPTKYLNVYVVRSINGNAAGYTFNPGSGVPPSGDVIVILCGYVGSIGVSNTTTSRALTHEVGHWFNLSHTWGGNNNPGIACGNDGVSDTPVTKGYTVCALNNAAICNPNIIENVQNYMDYSYCSTMFTIGQATRMQNSANNNVNGRNNLSTPLNLINTGVTNPLSNCIPQLDISVPSYTVCSGTSLLVSSYTAIANPSSYTWTISNGATVTSSTTTGANVLFNTIGNTTITCAVSNSFGGDSKTMVVNVVNGVTQITSTSPESFENGTIPPMWVVDNPTTPNTKWEVTSDGASSGLKSIYIKGEGAPAGSEEMIETPSYDFKNNQQARFTFSYAYRRSTTSNKDIFKVQATKDCGGTWTDVFFPPNNILAQTSGGTSTVTMIPASNWVNYDLVANSPYFLPFLSEENVKIRFYFKEDENGSGFGNRIYLDDVNFFTSVGINEITKSIGFNVYPNPSESTFNVNFTLPAPAKIKYKVISVTGSLMLEQAEMTFTEGAHEMTLNANGQLAKGIYFLNFEMNGINLCKKLIVN